MTRWVQAIFFFLLWAFAYPLSAADLTEKRPTARAWLVVDELTGVPLRFNRTREFRPIASTTKLLTALAVVESGNLGQWVIVSDNAARQQPSKMGLKAGERWRRRDLLYALLMQSANDAATALAEDISGSEWKFCSELTTRAQKLGASNVKILRASGLPAKGQGTTAEGLAIIARHAARNPKVQKILEMTHAQATSSKGRVINLKNKNRLHRPKEGPVLGKTGYTRQAGRCFAGTMTLEGRPHTIVLLGSKNLWVDLKLLRDWTKQFAKALNANRQRLTKDKVVHWQKRLLDLGFRPGPLDGLWGARTQRAFLSWQMKTMKRPHGKVS